MPIFGKASFKATRKVPKRKADAGSTNPAQLTDKAALDPNFDFSQTPLHLQLGGQNMVFQNGAWVAQENIHGSQSSVRTNEENTSLKGKLTALEEENNMLKYKIELLLDMLAVSQSDLHCMDQEIAQLRRSTGS